MAFIWRSIAVRWQRFLWFLLVDVLGAITANSGFLVGTVVHSEKCMRMRRVECVGKDWEGAAK